MDKEHQFKNMEFKRNIRNGWIDDETLLCKKRICKFSVQYLGSVEINGDNSELVYKRAMITLLDKKRRPGELRISAFSLVFQDRSTNALILDQTLKKVVICSNYILVPYSFFYIAEDTVSDICHLYGFVSSKEVSERIVNAIEYAMQLFGEHQHTAPKSLEFNPSTQDESNTTFRQITLAEKYQDPQSSIVLNSLPVKCSRTLPELKSIPRPRGAISMERKKFGDSFQKLNQDDMFKSNGGLSKSADPKTDVSANADLLEIFQDRSPIHDRECSQFTLEEKLRRIHQINEAFHKTHPQSFSNQYNDLRTENGGSQRYESLKTVNNEARLGWSSVLVRANESNQSTSHNSTNVYLDNIMINDFLQTNPFNSITENNLTWKF